MRLRVILMHLALPAVALVPLVAGAGDVVPAISGGSGISGVSRALGLFNVFVGLMLTVALLTYAIGFVVWVVRLGTWPSYRTEAIKIMEWSVVILFVLIVLLAIVQFFQKHPREAGYVLAVIIVIAIIAIIAFLVAHSGGGEKKKEEKKH